MGLHSLELSDFRNIESARLDFSSDLNLVSGQNAAGKTSLLEAIHCLGRVRSFRTPDSRQLIRHGQEACRVVGHIGRLSGGSMPVGIERRSNRVEVHVDGRQIHRLSDLAGHFPVQVMSGDTDTILSGGPRFRRQVMDWALFHVEQRYRETWQRYARALRQRNAALRAGVANQQVRAWDSELCETAGQVDLFRASWFGELQPLLAAELDRLLPGIEVQLTYQGGWPSGTSLDDLLVSGLERDRGRGCTGHGPHRADFSLRVNGRSVAACCSRGQQKAMVAGFALAMIKHQQQAGAPLGAFLFDDLGSELDEDHQARVLDALRGLGVQVFVSSIEALDIDVSAWPEARMFHVEQGRIRSPEG